MVGGVTRGLSFGVVCGLVGVLVCCAPRPAPDSSSPHDVSAQGERGDASQWASASTDTSSVEVERARTPKPDVRRSAAPAMVDSATLRPAPDVMVGDSPEGFALWVDARVTLPVLPTGATPSEGSLTLSSVGDSGSQGPVSVVVEGPFEVLGELGPLASGERRALRVRATLDVVPQAPVEGAARVSVDGWTASVPLTLLGVDPVIPEAVWTPAPLGEQTVVSLPSAPFPDGKAPYQDASVLVYVPESFTGRSGVHVVVHVHGYYGRLREVTARHHIREQLARSGRDAVLVAPQGPFDAADLSLGRLEARDGLSRLLRDVIALMARDGRAPVPRLGEVVLSAHSGGYKGAASMLVRGGVPIRGVHLFDALYARPEHFFQWARRGSGRRLRSSWTWRSSTEEQNEALVKALEGGRVRVASSLFDKDLYSRRVAVGWQRFSHDEVMRRAQGFERWVATSGLPAHPWAAPVLVSAQSKGAEAVVRWRPEPTRPKRRVVVEGSDDGVRWRALAESSALEARVPPTPWLRVRAEDDSGELTQPSDRYGATGESWLVVDGYDRSHGGRWSLPTHGFAAALGQALGAPFSTASHEAVREGAVRLERYKRVLWLVGDEGFEDVIFDAYERVMLRRFLRRGGRLILSGSRIGRSLRPDQLAARLGVRYVGEAPLSSQAGGFVFGQSGVPEPSPEVLDGEDVLWTYETGGGAAVGWRRQVVVVGFGLETLEPAQMPRALQALQMYFDSP